MYDKILQQTLLSKEQAVVYSVLVKNGPLPAGRLYQKTPLKRSLVYKLLDQLVELGLVRKNEVKGKVAIFLAEHPSKIRELFERKQNEASQAQSLLETVMPVLLSDFNLTVGKPGIQFFEGVEGLKKIYKDTLRPNNRIYALLSPDIIEPSLKKWLDSTYVRKRANMNIPAKVIVASSDKTSAYTELDKKYLRETTVVPRTKFPIDAEIDIYQPNKVAFISFQKKELIGIILESPAIYNTMKAFFDLAWAQAESSAKPLSPKNS